MKKSKNIYDLIDNIDDHEDIEDGYCCGETFKCHICKYYVLIGDNAPFFDRNDCKICENPMCNDNDCSKTCSYCQDNDICNNCCIKCANDDCNNYLCKDEYCMEDAFCDICGKILCDDCLCDSDCF